MPSSSSARSNGRKPPATEAARRWLSAAIALLAAGLMVDTWLAQGFLAPVVVHGGSMAPTLLGSHRQWRCAACTETFCCDLDSLPTANRAAICPHCGATVDTEQGSDHSGDRVLVDRSAFAWRGPRRWETVVLRSPDEPDTLCVKRVVGLPGEEIRIAAGNVLVGGKLVRKDAAVRRALSLPVCAAAVASEHWHSAADSAWQVTADRFRCASHDHQTHWLSYRHQEPQVAAGREAVWDSSPYDQSEARQLSPVLDLALRCEVKASGPGEIRLWLSAGSDRFHLRVAPATGAGQLEHQGRQVQVFSLRLEMLADTAVWEFGVADGRVQFAIGETTVLEYDFEPENQHLTEAVPALAIGASGCTVSLRNLAVLRDVYYTVAENSPASRYRLGPDEYFVLGDNSAHSEDSRVWTNRKGVSRQDLVGRAIVW